MIPIFFVVSKKGLFFSLGKSMLMELLILFISSSISHNIVFFGVLGMIEQLFGSIFAFFLDRDNNCYFPDEWQDGYSAGWNACLDIIIGEENRG